MSTDPRTVAFIVEQTFGAGDVHAKPMFGEYGIYCQGRMVALACDDQLFVKPTVGGRAFASRAREASPYPGAKPCLLIDAERWDDGEWLTELFRLSAAELPLPKPKRPRMRPASDPLPAVWRDFGDVLPVFSSGLSENFLPELGNGETHKPPFKASLPLPRFGHSFMFNAGTDMRWQGMVGLQGRCARRTWRPALSCSRASYLRAPPRA